MQVLHLHWLTPTRPQQHGRFFLWAETTAPTPPSHNRRKKSAQPHPFAANTKQAQTIRKLSANFRLALTGTPIENRLSELWSIMQFLNPGFLGGQKQFRQEFTLPIEKYGDEEAAQKLRKLTRPFLLRRVKTDPTVIQNLPDKQEMKVYCHLSEEQATLYEAVVLDSAEVFWIFRDGVSWACVSYSYFLL